MKKMIVPVVMLALFAVSEARAQAPVTVKRGPAPVTKAAPISVTNAPAVHVAPVTVGKTTTTTTTKSTPAKTVTKTTTTTVAAPAPAHKPAPAVHKPAAVKKTAHAPAKHHTAAKHHVAKKLKRIAPPPAPELPTPPTPPMPPAPIVNEEVVLPRPVAPVADNDDRNEMNGRDRDEMNDHKEGCSSCHDLPCDQPWRFRNRHKFTYDYIKSFYGKEGDCKHCGHDKDKKEDKNDD